MSRRVRRTVSATVTLAVASLTLTACFEEPSPHDAVRDFLVGWQSEDYALAAGRTDGDPKAVAKALSDTKLDLDAASFRFKVEGITRDGDESTATFGAEIDLGENVPLWTYKSTLPLHLVDGQWKVRWSPSVLHPKLKDGQRFAVKTEAHARATINDRENSPLQTDDNLYVAGVTPDTLGGHPEQVVEQLASITKFAEDRLLSRIRSSPPSDFVPLVTFGRERYRKLEAQLDQIKGITVQTQRQPVRPDDPKDIVGRVTALTPESEQKLGGPQRAGDSNGINGLQKAYQDELTGSTQIQVITLDLKTGKEADLLKEWPGRENSAVTTTIDSDTQSAAENAVLTSGGAALVAVQASTGEIRAIATKDYSQTGDALNGKFPPGTTFSIVAADALLKAKVKPSQRVPCPAVRTVGGAKFEQVSQSTGVGGSPTVLDNFANGCVTALAALARRVDANALTQSATGLGIGVPWKLPLKSFSGTLPELASDAEKARAIAGQNVEVSPLSMALVAGAVASGTWRPPVLVTAPSTPDPAAAVVPVAPPKPVALSPAVRKTLVAMMRAGVGGSARAAQAGSSKVYGVTATVNDEDKQQLNWFVGWQGDLAVAVLAKSPDAAAVAGRFFGGLGNSQ